MNKTATETLQRQEDERLNSNLNEQIRYFLKRFEPEDRRDRHDFEMFLHEIVRTIYREASRPYERALLGAALIRPLDQLIIKTDGKIEPLT